MLSTGQVIDDSLVQPSHCVVSALINSHLIKSALHHDHTCVAEQLVCGHTPSPVCLHIRGESVRKASLPDVLKSKGSLKVDTTVL